jgi:hypothetical protein
LVWLSRRATEPLLDKFRDVLNEALNRWLDLCGVRLALDWSGHRARA